MKAYFLKKKIKKEEKKHLLIHPSSSLEVTLFSK